MDIGGATASVAVAVVGVVGTLLSALLTQRAADRGHRRELEHAERVRERRAHTRELRSCYVALNTSARQYLAALTDQMHALGRGDEARVVRQRLAEARDQYRDVYAEAQMRLPEPVLDLAGDLSHELGVVYGMVRRLDEGAPRAGDAPDAVRAGIEAQWGRLRRMRREMRADLGVSGADSGR
ncbi:MULTISPECIES: hypothetical protein [unclassified Streptomyces]|uniref:hypothetical protein n=1 Tax=unclassified Streptomyces TaxID=2593676 RepID=UPI001CD58590|nr:hypothetical protein [Streptomyces sp. CoH27]